MTGRSVPEQVFLCQDVIALPKHVVVNTNHDFILWFYCILLSAFAGLYGVVKKSLCT